MGDITTTCIFFLIIGMMILCAFEFRRCLNTTIRVDGPEFDSHSAHVLLMQRGILYQMNESTVDPMETYAFHQGWMRRINAYVKKHSIGKKANDPGRDNDNTLH